jgi:PAS domain S-box-containing protein
MTDSKSEHGSIVESLRVSGHETGFAAPPETARRIFRAVTQVGSIALSAVGPVVLVGWVFGLSLLTSITPGSPRMAASTALAFSLCGYSLYLYLSRRLPLARVAAAAVAAIGTLSVTRYVSGWRGADSKLVSDAAAGLLPGQMAFATAAGCVLAGMALLFLESERRRWQNASQVLALAVLGIFGFALTGYASESSFLRTQAFYTWLAPGTIAAFVVLALSLLCAQEDRGLLRIFTSRYQGGAVARRLVLPAIVLPVLFARLRLLGEAHRWYDAQFGTALFTLFDIIVIVGLVWWTTVSLDRSDGRLEQALRILGERQQRFRLLVMASSQIVWTTDAAGMVVEDIPGWREVTGQSIAELQGDGWLDAVHPEDRDAVLESWRVAQGGRKIFELEYRLRRRDGVYSTFAMHGLPVLDEQGSLREWVGTCSDVSERKQIERMKDELISTVSHELRTPLASLRGFAELMLSREYPEEKRRGFLTIIHNESKRLTSLINNFLDIQRMEAGKQTYNLELVDLSAMVRDTIALFEVDSRYSFELDVRSRLPLVRVDTDRIRQVLANLVSNAMKYSPDGGNITIRMGSANGELQVAVVDQGIGIAAEALPRLFSKFYRVSGAVNRGIGGTGLGLTLVKQIIEDHHGRVWVESAPDQGSSFFFAIPVAEKTLIALDPGSWQSTDILLVEDDKGFAELLSEHFESMGYTVQSTAYAEQALEIARIAPPKVILLDLCLAGAMGGWELLVELKGDERLQRIPAVVVTVSEPNVRGLALGGAEYVLKSSAPDLLLKQVRRLIPLKDGKRILVADDDEVYRKFLARFLAAEAGVIVEEAADGKEAMELIGKQIPDLLLLDLFMPGMDGFEVLDCLRSDPRAVNTQVLVVTARDLTSEEKKYIRRRMASLVGKKEATLDYFAQIVERTIGPRVQARAGIAS